MHAKLADFFNRSVPAFTRRLSDLAERVGPSAEPRDDNYLAELTDAIACSSRECSKVESLIGDNEPLLRDTRERFRQAIAEWFDRSWFMQRAKEKPRGYPGDYELLTAIYERRVKTRGLGGYLDLYFLNTALSRAVRARLMAAKMFLIQEVGRRRGDVKILNVASGPCREYVDGFLYFPNCRVHITCVDSDRQAVEYVRANIMSVEVDLPDMACTCYNALRMSSAKNNIRKFGRCDIIYSVGLCDYIPDKYLVPLIRGLRDTLNQDGALYIAFKDRDRYDKTEYQWHVDWHFFQRTEGDCRELFRLAGFDANSIEMTRTGSDVIMNFVARVKRPALIRVDGTRDAAWEPARADAPSRHGNHQRTIHG